MATEGIESDAKLSPADRLEALAFYTAFPPSVACGDTSQDLAPYRASLGDVCSDVAQFGWIAAIALACIGIGAFAAIVAALSALAAYLGRGAQVDAFVVGWNVLRVVGALEVLGQGVLAVFLSFWMTAIWFEVYYVKLIVLVGLLALMGVVMVVRAIFQRLPEGLDVEGEILEEARALELWGRLRSLCASLGTTPPNHLVVGIDDNFYVTEAEVRVGGRALTGRTLYLSLSLLRVLERGEAEAVFAHEMAHLLGGDTARSKKLAPMMNRFGHYLGALYQNVLARPVFYFMNAYFAIFELAVASHRRARELEADAVAAGATSPLDIARSLLKIGAYSSYRARVEDALFEKDSVHADLGITRRVALGFADYARTEKLQFDMHDA
ncbi:MAG: M48 family metalloprotease, partial [Polyangiaceae bacterium]|nr:M48 family metalloprotease [Polyangiaceae bacterium]